MRKIACFDCENKWSDEALVNVKEKGAFSQSVYTKEYKKLFNKRMKDKSFCEHFTIEYWKNLGFEDSWGDAAVRNYPHLTIMRWSDETDTKFLILAPYVARRPVILNAKDPNAWGSY